MEYTNYHLYDVLDFDPDGRRDESLWTACLPTSVEATGGRIVLTVPFQRQLQQNDMQADDTAPREVRRVVLTAYTHDILRLQVTDALPAPDAPAADGLPTASLEGMDACDPMLAPSADMAQVALSVSHEDGLYTVSDAEGRTRAHIDTRTPRLDPWSDLLPPPQQMLDLRLYPEAGNTGKAVALSAYDHFSPPRYDALPLAIVHRPEGDAITLSVAAEANECYVGTGERFAKMDLAGRTLALRNQDGQGVNNRRCYKNVPFYLSSRLYGLFYHTRSRCTLDLADHSTRSVQFVAQSPTLDAFVIGGATPERILYAYRCLTGFPPMLPLWSFGIWMSRMTYFSADEVEGICQRLRADDYPCDVIHLDTGWFRTDWLCEWRFNPERFPDPAAFIARLRQGGFRVSLWQLPYVAEEAEQLPEALAHDYIAPRADRSSNGSGSNFSSLDYAGTIDFTSPAATAWYKGLLRPLLEMGVSCIKTDFGENIHMDARYAGLPARELANVYSTLYQRAAYEATREVTGDGIVWGRSAWGGGQRYPLHWGGDSAHSWDGMAGSLRGGLHFGLSGFAFWSHDVPGFHSVPDFMNSPLRDDLYVRWTQFGVFTSHIRYHGTCKREPWHYPEIADTVRRWWKLRYRLLPYTLQAAREATQSGYPMLRAMLFAHPDDPVVWHIDDQYYYGSDLLVCPVMNAEGRRDIYLPEGEWVHLFTGQRFSGPRWLRRVEVPLDQMPVYVRPGTVLPLYDAPVQCTDQMDLSRVTPLTIGDDFAGLPF